MSLRAASAPLSRGAACDALLGTSDPMRQLRREIAELGAGAWRAVLVVGETGTGKELVARALAAASGRRGRLEVFNCPAVPADHLESELFGTTRGAYPGAVDRPGAAERAHGGVLFLDEIASMPLGHQAKVLRLLEAGEARRLGAPQVYVADLAVVAATNVAPRELRARGLLRQDLYWRLVQDGVLEVPPLRERPGDVACLARRFAAELPTAPPLAPDALARLARHDWPGNVRELRAVVRAAARAAGAGAIGAAHVDSLLRRLHGPEGADVAEARPPAFAVAGRADRARLLVEALAASAGNRTQAGIRLGFHLARGQGPRPLDQRARQRAHRRFRYWWERLVEAP